MPTTSVENIFGSASSLETSIYSSLTNVLPCADLPAHDNRVLDFSEDDSSFLGLVDADMHAGTTSNVSKDAESLVDESLSLDLVTTEMHTDTTAHVDGRVVKSPASGVLIDLADGNADVHIRNTVETDANAASSVDACLISGSPVLDVEFTGFAVSDVLSPCCSVFGSLNSDISLFYPWHTKSAIIAGLGTGPKISGSMNSYNPIYAPGSVVLAGWGLGQMSPGLCWACVILFTPLSQLLLLDWATVLQFLGSRIC